MQAMHTNSDSTSTDSTARSGAWSVRTSIRESTLGWRISAAIAATVALACTYGDAIPLASGVALAALLPAVLVDVIDRRLPNRLVAAAALCGAAALLGEWIVVGIDAPGFDWSGAVIGVAAMAGPLLIMHIAAPAALGFGDVKAAAVAGAALGLVHPILGLVALAIGSAATALVGLAQRRRNVVFGPGLVGGSIIALVLVVSPLQFVDLGVNASPAAHINSGAAQ